MASFRQINYALRPAKSVERKMMVEAFRRLELGWPLATYRYIGMGSVYFADFQLVHQALGIDDMISMEREIGDKPRFEFNRPYRCVDIRYGECSELLETLPWEKPSIVWLDYDGKLSSSVISELKTAIQNVQSGSVVAVSVNVAVDQPDKDGFEVASERDDWRLQAFTDRVGMENVPLDTKGSELRGPKLAKICWEILSRAVLDQLAIRNGRNDLRPDTLKFQQIFHFRYEDGAQMLTVGWIIYTEADQHLADRCDFGTLPFTNSADRPVDIHAPKLTPKEIRHLNGSLPEVKPVIPETLSRLASQTGIPKTDIERFASIYRHYPQYVEIAL